jgi:hypothetical protein
METSKSSDPGKESNVIIWGEGFRGRDGFSLSFCDHHLLKRKLFNLLVDGDNVKGTMPSWL